MKNLVFFFLLSLMFMSPIGAFSFNTQDRKLPIEIQAKNGMICSQDKKTCKALGPVVSTKGSSVLKSSELIVYFKDASRSPKEKARDSPQQDIDKIEALGHVHFLDIQGAPNDKLEATGHYALYKAEEGKLTLQGRPVLKDSQTIILGGKEIIYYEKIQKAKTVGRSTVKRDDKLMQADVLTVYFTRGPKGQLVFDRVEAQGNVLISTPTEIAKAKRGVYANTTQVAELFGDVVITRSQGQLRGNYGRYDMASGQSQIFQDQKTLKYQKQVQAILRPKALKRTNVNKKTL